MALSSQYNMRSPGVKRLLREAMELAEPTDEYYATPLDDNLFEWHFTVKGPSETEFEGGYYHGRILMPPQYPMQPPNIILLTPNGRFEINKKICLSISGYHPETWQPSWSIRTALLALIAFMPTKAVGTIGSLDYTPEERKVLAQKSKNWECDLCGKIADKLISSNTSHGPALTQEESNMVENIALKSEEDANRNDSVSIDTANIKDNEILTEQSSDSNSNTGDTLRQRNMPDAPEENMPNVPEDVSNTPHAHLEMNEEQRKSDDFWTATIYVILGLILLLLVRRFFFCT